MARSSRRPYAGVRAMRRRVQAWRVRPATVTEIIVTARVSRAGLPVRAVMAQLAPTKAAEGKVKQAHEGVKPADVSQRSCPSRPSRVRLATP